MFVRDNWVSRFYLNEDVCKSVCTSVLDFSLMCSYIFTMIFGSVTVHYSSPLVGTKVGYRHGFDATLNRLIILGVV